MTYHKWFSPALGQEMELKVYGHAGKPALVFPSGGGRFFEFEDFGMVEACRPFLEAGRLQLFTVDSVDNQAWYNRGASVADRARRHEQYERYIIDEVVPFVRSQNEWQGPLMTTGCSGGGYHAANFLFKRPDLFDAVVALSGLYGPQFVFGEHWDDALYFHFPLCYLPKLDDPGTLDLIRRAQIVLCVGQGKWEQTDDYDCIRDTLALGDILAAKGLPAWVDLWGADVDHDWVWWRKQLPYFLSKTLPS